MSSKRAMATLCLRVSIVCFFVFPAISQLSAGELVGQLPGTMSQTAGGAATYRLTIDLPPAPASIKPGVALVYDSDAGNGPVGRGWRLEAGFSQITRVGQTYDLDGRRTTVALDPQGSFATDRLALDGNRLMLVSGNYGAHLSEYRTRVETYQKVVAIDTNLDLPGPERFEAHMRDGSLRVYGKYIHHRIQVGGTHSPVYSWLLSEIVDRHGNTCAFDYYGCPDSGGAFCAETLGREYLPKGVSYEGRTVLFTYETRPDRALTYRAGLAFSQTYRLDRLDIYVNADGDADHAEQEDFAYGYDLSYAEPADTVTAQSRLTSITKIAADGSTLPPTRFEWLGDNRAVGFTPYPGYTDSAVPLFAKVRNWANQTYNGKYNEGTHMVDLNGDGLQDLIQGVYYLEDSDGDGQEIKRKVLLNRLTHWEKLEEDHPYLADWAAAGSSALFSVRSNMGGDHPGGDLGTRFADLNGDGLMDLIQLADGTKSEHDDLSKPDTRMRILLNEGEAGGWFLVPDDHPWIAQMQKLPNGDPALFTTKLYRDLVYHIGTENGGTVLADLDGDGRTDLLNLLNIGGGLHYDAYLNKGEHPENGGWRKTNAYHASLTHLLNPETTWNEKSYFAESLTHNQGRGAWRSDVGLRLRDLDGDGLPDLIVLNHGHDDYPTIAQVALNKGPENGFEYDAAYSNSLPTDDQAPFFTECHIWNVYHRLGTRLMDINGDGLPDLVRLYNETYDGTPIKRVLLNTGKAFVAADDWAMPADDVFFSYYHQGEGVRDGGTRMADINSDGLMDMLTFFYDENGQHRRSLYLGEQSEGFRGWRLAPDVQGRNDWWTGIPDDFYFIGRDGDELFDMGTRIDDVNGDGRLDLIQLAEIEGLYTEKRFLLGSGALVDYVDGGSVYQTGVDQIWRVRAGLGAITEIDYGPASLGGFLYRKRQDAAYPIRDLTPYKQLVARILEHQPLGNSATSQTKIKRFSYRHFRAAHDIPNGGQPGNDGAGVLGFRYIDVVDDATQITTRTHYAQDNWRYWGRPSQIRMYRTGDYDHVYGRQNVMYRVDDDILGRPGLTYRVDRISEDNLNFEDGQWYLTTRVEWDFDDFGNLIGEFHLGDPDNGADNRFIHYFYQNDTAAWRLGWRTREVHATSKDPHATASYRNDIAYGYDGRDNLATKTWRNMEHPDENAVTTFFHNASGNLISKISATGEVTEYEYDPVFNFFQTAVIKDPDDAAHRIEFRYDPTFGTVTHFWDPHGILTRTTYDAFGRKAALYREEPDSRIVTMRERYLFKWADTARKLGSYQELLLRQTWDANINQVRLQNRIYRDCWDRPYLSWTRGSGDAMTVHEHTRYDAAGRVSHKSQPYTDGNPSYIRIYYDVLGRQTRTVHPVASADDVAEEESYSYDFEMVDGKNYPVTRFEGRHVPGAEPGKVTISRYDGRKRIVERRFVEDDGSEASTLFTFDGLDRPIMVTSQENRDGQRVRTVSSWDSLNRRYRQQEQIVSQEPDGSWTVHESRTHRYEFDLEGRITQYRAPAGNVIDQTYDIFGRKETMELSPSLPDGLARIGFTYDQADHGIGKLSGISGETGNAAVLFRYDLGYDKFGNLETERVRYDQQGPWTFQYRYRPDGLKSTTTYPDGAVLARGYTSLNWPASLRLDEPGEPGRITVTFEDHHPHGAPGRVVYGNGAVTEYHYRSHDLRLEGMDVFDGADQAIAMKTYGWTTRGQLDYIYDQVAPQLDQDFSYDAQLRLAAADGVYGSKDYHYDPMGNLLTKGDVEMLDFRGYRLTRARDHARDVVLDFDYDTNGNTTLKTTGDLTEHFDYDALDRMIGYRREAPDQATVRNAYAYDHSGRRYKKVDSDGGTTYYVTPSYETFLMGDLQRETKYVVGPEGKLAQSTRLTAPDLVVRIVDVQVLEYDRVRVACAMENVGTAASGAFVLGLHAPRGEASHTMDGLAPGAVGEVVLEIQAGFGERVTAVADDLNQIVELDETNNSDQDNVHVGPDLVLSRAEAIPIGPESFKVKTEIRNLGSVNAPTSLLALFLDDEVLGYWPMRDLLPGQSDTLEVTIDAREGQQVAWLVDAKNHVLESSESNNDRIRELGIADFRVVAMEAEFDPDKGTVAVSVGIQSNRLVAMNGIPVHITNLQTRERIDGLAKLNKPSQISWFAAHLEGQSGDRFLATVNPGREVFEPNYANNSGSLTWTADFDFEPLAIGGFEPGSCLDLFTLSLANHGSKAGGPVSVRVMVTPKVGSGSESFEIQTVTADIDAEGTVKVPIYLQRPWCPSLRVQVTVDPENAWPESDETNNVRTFDIETCPSCGEARTPTGPAPRD
ncbi:CARDB domain-containing protein [Sulfidibacter corallicola]|uniref:CARDB domain-containing protein n=1 Tax=Sulfidibacter corallicola TaxID=2818388 RepID=A0A8A4TMB4_SULCO|nr:CARDB domain-containing protein [Sulfidibacter corallicola]QTD50021.1 hypothetical protein J3U87_30935 [Sulfidibacter corallicola]